MPIVAGTLKIISTTKACASATNYAAEDVISNSATAGTSWTFAEAGRSNGAYGWVVGAIILCETTAQTPRLSLYLFNALPTSNLNDNAANTAVLNADISQYIGRIDFPALSDLGGDSEAVATPSTYGNLPLPFKCADNADDLYGILVTRDAITGETATDDYTIKLFIEQY